MSVLIVNGCADLIDHATVQKWVAAIQKQIDGDFAPAWNARATLVYAGDGIGATPGARDCIIRLVRQSADPGTLGSHWFDGSHAVGEVGVQTCIDDGVQTSSCLSHELLELLFDPFATLAFQIGRFFLAAEVCDRVEDSDPDYVIDGVHVENFSLPAAFEGTGGPWDFRGKCPANVILSNGYQLQVDSGSGQWSQQTGERARRSKRAAGPNSRRALRMRKAGADPSTLVIL